MLCIRPTCYIFRKLTIVDNITKEYQICIDLLDKMQDNNKIIKLFNFMYIETIVSI
jgi:hypothetical protein